MQTTLGHLILIVWMTTVLFMWLDKQLTHPCLYEVPREPVSRTNSTGRTFIHSVVQV